MTTNNNTRENNIIVCFWTHRGGLFNNSGYVEYIDDIEDFQEVVNNYDIIDLDENDEPLPDDEWRLLDGGGNELLRGRDEIEAHTGELDRDGEYDTWRVKYLDECWRGDWQAILEKYREGGVWRPEVKEAVLEHFGLAVAVEAAVKDPVFDGGRITDATISLYGGNGECADIHYHMEYFYAYAAERAATKAALSKGFDPLSAKELISSAIIKAEMAKEREEE